MVSRGSTRQQVISRLVHRFEQAGLRVVKTEQGLTVRVPGFDTAWFPVELPLGHLDDHLHVEVSGEGEIAYHWVYWTRLQVALHGVIATIFVFDVCLRQALTMELVLSFLAAQAVPLVVFLVSTQLRGQSLFADS